MPTALVRRPSPHLAEGIVTHLERTPVDADLAVRQWQQYVDALEATGWTTVEVPPLDECPDSVFIEDTMVVYGDLAVIARAGAEQRRPEAAAAERTVGYEPLVDDPQAFEVFKPVPEESGSHVVLLGEDRLLMAASAPKSAELFEQFGYTPVVVDISEFEKLEGCVTCLSVRLRR